MKKREKTMKNDEKERKKQWTMMKNTGKIRKHDETWEIEKKQWNMMNKEKKTRKIRWWKRVKKTMKHDEKRGKKQGSMMKNRVTTMKNDET